MKSARFFSVVLLLVLVVAGLFGCSSGGQDVDSEQQPTGAGNNETITIQYGHPQPINTPHDKAAILFKEEVEKESNGRIKVDVYPASQLADTRGMAEGVQLGTIEMAMMPAAVLSNFDAKLNLISFPFLFPNEEVLWEVLDGSIGQELLNGLEAKGIKGLSYWAVGFNQFTANKPILSVDDLKGLKWRVMASPLVIDQYNTWGANPTAIDFTELYNSLQQGVVDGQENPLQSIVSAKLYEVQKALTMSNHSYMAYVVIANNKWFNELSKEDQELLTAAMRKATLAERQMIRDEEEAYLKEIQDYGVEVYYMTDEERAAFAEASLPVHKAHEDEVSSELLQKVYQEVEKLTK